MPNFGDGVSGHDLGLHSNGRAKPTARSFSLGRVSTRVIGPAPPPIGPAPSNLVLTYLGVDPSGEQAGTLSWSHNGNPNSYVVELMTNGNTPTANPTAWTSWTFGNIVYWIVGNYYRVGAVYASGTAYSDPILCDGVIPV